ncbi:TPA: hypothetical protein ACS4RZ_001388, partial [Streptococcus pyogenes]
MKTKSKRFLNLATLCLALLGTTLLTTQPVKANSDTRKSHERLDQKGENPYQEGKENGYSDGQRDGKKEGSSPEPPQNHNYHNPYTDFSKKYLYKQAYEEWYNHGYYKSRLELQGQQDSSDSSD